ncbi:MAG: hypothetical protein V3W20_04040 [Candidatus Neomarinimicrobiota bacterium]
MLGFVLTSVFFFFGIRQRATIEVQRDTAEILNVRSYLKSYADYLEKNSISLVEKNTPFDDIEVSLTKIVNEIEEFVDNGQTIRYEFGENRIINIEWNKCTDELRGDLFLGTTYTHDTSTADCNASSVEEYDDAQVNLTVNSFDIKTANAPFQYKITGENLVDNKWHLVLSKDLDYGKIVTVKRVFK